ncbi:hypothetical protein HPB48_003682 [Haemaphysalis longicornis]|uniref:Retrotransposon gag domain-containing protein n=1 Tax=Haemaphysalis longicornis TaxID=44386 RepID=A0A9J6FG04_HAELO|nr:hypothetical protein HPB48_003682 [Haemaphysalis longicornis]
MCASQKGTEDVQSYAARLRTLGSAAMSGRGDVEPESKREIRRELPDEQLRPQFLNGLRDPIKRFTLSRDLKTLDEAVDTAVREERNERAVNNGHAPVRSVREGDRETDDLRARLKRVEGLLEASIELQNNKCATATAEGGMRRDGGPVTTAGSTATFRGTVKRAGALRATPELGEPKHKRFRDEPGKLLGPPSSDKRVEEENKGGA